MPRIEKHEHFQSRPTIGQHLETCENKGKFTLPFEAKLAWFLLVALASAKYFLNI